MIRSLNPIKSHGIIYYIPLNFKSWAMTPCNDQKPRWQAANQVDPRNVGPGLRSWPSGPWGPGCPQKCCLLRGCYNHETCDLIWFNRQDKTHENIWTCCVLFKAKRPNKTKKWVMPAQFCLLVDTPITVSVVITTISHSFSSPRQVNQLSYRSRAPTYERYLSGWWFGT